jgi:DNA-binding NarL/FixJ family response regulator
MEQRTVRVVLADDHAMVRKGIRDFLEEDPTIKVVAEASDGEQAVAAVEREQPDVAIFDIQMPRLSGLDAAQRVRQRLPAVRVLMLTAYEDEPYIIAALRAGVSGYLLKTAGSEELVRAVHSVADGETALSPAVARKMVQRTFGGDSAEHVSEPLTERELEVLRFAAKGLGNRQIAQELGISDRTVDRARLSGQVAGSESCLETSGPRSSSG